MTPDSSIRVCVFLRIIQSAGRLTPRRSQIIRLLLACRNARKLCRGAPGLFEHICARVSGGVYSAMRRVCTKTRPLPAVLTSLQRRFPPFDPLDTVLTPRVDSPLERNSQAGSGRGAWRYVRNTRLRDCAVAGVVCQSGMLLSGRREPLPRTSSEENNSQ